MFALIFVTILIIGFMFYAADGLDKMIVRINEEFDEKLEETKNTGCKESDNVVD